MCLWSWCVFWKKGLNVLARCWYSGWNLIVLGKKYVVCLCLWAVGCDCIILGIGPGLGWISPHCNVRRFCWMCCFVVMLNCMFLLGIWVAGLGWVMWGGEEFIGVFILYVCVDVCGMVLDCVTSLF